MNEAASENLSSRALERQIGTLYYERLLVSKDRPTVQQEAQSRTQARETTPREFVRDPVLLEFLGMPNPGAFLESDLEQALMNQLQSFLLELGKGFAFVARQQRLSTESKDFYLDLVFSHLNYDQNDAICALEPLTLSEAVSMSGELREQVRHLDIARTLGSSF